MNKFCVFIFFLFAILLSSDTAAFDNYMKNKEYSDALSEIDVLHNNDPKNPEYLFMKHSALIFLDNLDEAYNILKLAIELAPRDEGYRDASEELLAFQSSLKSAKKSYDNGLFSECVKQYKAIIEKYPERATAYNQLGQVYKKNKDYDMAVKNFNMAYAMNPFKEEYNQSTIAISQMIASEGDQEFKRREFSKAIALYEKAIKYYPNFDLATFKLAKSFYYQGNYDDAAFYLKKCIDINPNHATSYEMLGDISIKKKNIEEAILNYKKAVGIDNNLYTAYYRLGRAIKRVDKDEAITYFNKCININPQYDKAYEALGEIQLSNQNIDDALSTFIKGSEIKGKQYYVLLYRISNIYNTKEKFNESRTYAKKSIDVKKNYVPAYFELGLAERGLGNKAAATSAFKKARNDRNFRKSANFYLCELTKSEEYCD